MDGKQNKTIYDLLHRRSYRAFKPEMVQQEDLEQIIRCGLHAPSANNCQPWHFTVVRNTALLDEMSAELAKVMKQSGEEAAIKRASAADFHCFYHAPCAVLISGPESEGSRVTDGGGAVQNLALAAQALGLGSVIVASVMPVFQGVRGGEFMERLKIPAGFVPMLTLAIGYPACAEPDVPERKTDVVTYID